MNLARKVTEDVGIGELHDKLKDDILTPHLTMMGPVRTLTPTGFRNLMLLWKTAGLMNGNSRKGGKVEEVFKRIEGVEERFELNVPSARSSFSSVSISLGLMNRCVAQIS